MKRLLSVCGLLALLSFPAFGQDLTNAGFESWTGGSPDSWVTDNSGALTPITQSTDAHGGTYAAQGTVVASGVPGFNIAPVLILGDNDSYAMTTRYAALQGWFKFANPAGATFDVTVVAYKGVSPNQTGIAAGAYASSDNVATYKLFTAPLFYGSADMPDHATVSLTIANVGSSSVGTSFVVDDLSWSLTTDVTQSDSRVPKTFALDQNYPNPFNPSTTITFQVAKTQQVTIAVFNILGQQVALLADGVFSPGKYRVTFDASNVPSGTYFYRMETPGFVQVRKLAVLK